MELTLVDASGLKSETRKHENDYESQIAKIKIAFSIPQFIVGKENWDSYDKMTHGRKIDFLVKVLEWVPRRFFFRIDVMLKKFNWSSKRAIRETIVRLDWETVQVNKFKSTKIHRLIVNFLSLDTNLLPPNRQKMCAEMKITPRAKFCFWQRFSWKVKCSGKIPRSLNNC